MSWRQHVGVLLAIQTSWYMQLQFAVMCEGLQLPLEL